MTAGEARPPTVVVAPDGFKGSLSAQGVAAAIAAGIRRVAKDARVVEVPLADGGDGTLEAFAAAAGDAASWRTERVTGPLGEEREAQWLHVAARGGQGATGLVEMARASGLVLVPEPARDPLVTTTRGTGELVTAALRSGVGRLLVTVGGSATNDGGTGLARALGYRFLDADGRDLPEGGGALERLDRVDPSGAVEEVRALIASGRPEVVGLVDVDNPLCGPEGASAVYGPQKGADPARVARLDRALGRLAEVAARDLGPRAAGVAERPGAGAAGGLGAGLIWFLGASLRPGAEAVLDGLGFEERLRGASCVFTGEGRVDGQTARGKVVAAVARRARAAGVPVWVIAGTKGSGWEDVIERCGVARVETIARVGDAADEAAAIADAAPRLERLAASLYEKLREQVEGKDR